MTQAEYDKIAGVLNGSPWLFRDNLKTVLAEMTISEELPATKVTEETRSTQQNKALWKFFGQVADALTARGVTMRSVFQNTTKFDIPPSKDNVHDLWVYFQKALYSTESTRELKRREQIDRVHEVMMKNLGETFGIDYIDFPSEETKTNYGFVAHTKIPYPSDYKEPLI